MARLIPNISPLQWGLVSLNVIVRVYCGLFMIISDCDETYNYWEPLNLLLRGFGKQTWEYSPEYAIRSYAYLLPYYLVAYPLQLVLGEVSLKQFYWLRLVAFAGFTSYTEIRLFRSIQRNLGSSKIANWFLFFSSVAPGMSHASIAFLPSSFAMNYCTLAFANVLAVVSNKRSSESRWGLASLAICQFIFGGVVGWPFALALAVPFGFYVVVAHVFHSPLYLLKVIAGSVAGLALIVSGITIVDSWFYKQWVLVPLNIVLYNVFNGEGEGPEIFGVEDFSYYVLNMLLNFNATFVLGYAGSVLNPLASVLLKEDSKSSITSSFLIISATLLLWSGIFASQPHKEERFLYPIYTLLCLNAAIFVDFCFTLFKRILSGVGGKPKLGKHTASIASKLALALVAALVGTVSILRIFSLVENYSAPISVSADLFEVLKQDGNDNGIDVCVGREWYHFPTSFFLPQDARLRFVKSGFDGLLPGDFLEFESGEANLHSISDVSSSIPFDMNNKNQYSPSKVIPFEQCHYFIDIALPVDIEQAESSIIELDKNTGNAVVVDKDWEIVTCSKLISLTGSSSGIGKILWIPTLLRPYVGYNVDYTQFCSLKRIQ